MFATWWGVAAELTGKATAVLAAAALVNVLLWRASAAARHMVWVLALGGLLVLPAFQVILPSWSTAKVRYAAVTEVHVTSSRTGTSGSRTTPSSNTIPMAAFSVWMAGVLVCSWRWTRGIAKVARIRNGAGVLSHGDVGEEAGALAGMRRRIPLLRSSQDIVPMATGLRHPVVLLPANAREWSRERMRAVLLHEMAHVRRRDSLTQALAELARCVYWFHPLVWLAVNRLQVERERACDDLVLSTGTGASDYASHLLGLARSLQPAELSPAAVSMAGSHLETRIRAILNPSTNRRAIGRAAGAMAYVAAACFVLPLAAMRPQAGDVKAVSGTVYDPAGARVPGANVIAVRTDSGQKLTTSTDQEGNFSIGPLAEGGPWQITIEAPGFARSVQRVSKNRFDITLDIGQIQENVVVHGKGTAAAAAGPRRVRVGGNVVPAKLVYKVDPEYPEDARSRGVQGDVVLRAVVSLKGTVLSLTSISAPDPQLAEAAMKAVREWRYQPSLLNGEPLETVTTITVNFQLEP